MLTQKFAEYKKMSRIAKLINLELLENDYVFSYSEISLSLVKSLSVRTKLTGFLLLKTLLRFGDLYNFNLQQAINFKSFSLIQNKTGKTISQPFSLKLEPLRYELLTFPDWQLSLNYNMIANEIKRFVRQATFLPPMEWKHNAHIFRHLEATYMSSLEVPIFDIAGKLGDTESIVQNSYIHNELKFLFS